MDQIDQIIAALSVFVGSKIRVQFFPAYDNTNACSLTLSGNIVDVEKRNEHPWGDDKCAVLMMDGGTEIQFPSYQSVYTIKADEHHANIERRHNDGSLGGPSNLYFSLCVSRT